MLTKFRVPALKAALASVALGALVPLAACNQGVSEKASVQSGLPDLPATLPLALGDERPVTYAPPVEKLPKVKQIKAARVANPDDYYAYADDAWSYYDALGDAPPDYGFYYDGVEPWGWQGYDDSMMFVEPLDAGYRYYYYRPGQEYPYFVRDPYYSYGYDDGLLAVVYNALGGIVPYDDYYDYPYLDYASTYYDRGYDLYYASRTRHPVIAANWYAFQPTYNTAFLDWEEDLWSQPDWWDYHERTYDRRYAYWDVERARREAEAVRFATWQDLGFQAASPPRAIPVNWRRADWAQDERYYAPAFSGFDGNTAEQRRAARREQLRIASLPKDVTAEDRVHLAELRQRAPRRVDVEARREQRMAAVQDRLERRQVQLASRQDRAALQERAQLQRQERALASVQQREQRSVHAEVRRNRAAERQQFAGVDRRQLREAAREQRVNQAERGRQDRLARNEAVEQRRQAQVEARQQRADRDQRRQAAQQQRAQRDEARQAAQQQRAQRDQARQAAQQQRAQRDQARQAAQQQRVQRDQARQAAQQQRVQRDQARQAAQQQRVQRDQARQAAQQQQAQRDQARQAAQQQRVQRDQARQAAQQQQAQREQARQAAQAQQAQRDQARQAAESQRAARVQAQQAEQQQRAAQAQARQAERSAQAEASRAANPDKENRGRRNN